MLLAVVAAMIVAQANAPSKDFAAQLTDPMTGETSALVLQRFARLEPAKLSPREVDGKHWEFDWLTSGYGKVREGQQDLRFRVFSQERKQQNDVAFNVATMDLRIWQLLYHKYKIDHQDMGNGLKLVDEYLCWGGTAGGEQLFGEDTEAGHTHRVNTIYIYDIASFKDPMEMAREVAHEYGHAVLPAAGGFETPEDWANGYLGEKLFLRWLRDAYLSRRIDSTAVMNVPFDTLDKWVKKNVDPLVLDAASHAPNKALLAAHGQKAMNAYMGLVLYADAVLPNSMVARAFKLTGSTSARDYPDALVEACSEGSYTIFPPQILNGKKLWLPLGKSKVQGGKVTARSGSWAEVQPTAPNLVILAPES